ncbi:MAG: Hemolysin-type calcium-binding region [Deltaproteobacteria bacterium]|nr:Hemolysin-type calcium-binding region [Deltaproteobacteria bacterium]
MLPWVGISVFCAACGRLNFDPIDDALPPDDGSLPGNGTLVLRDKLAGYTGTTDTYIDQLAPQVEHHLTTTMPWGGTQQYALLHFDTLFGPTRIPAGSTIESATLRLVLATACTGPSVITEIAIGWASTTTWDMFGPLPGVQAGDQRGVPTMLPTFSVGPATIDVTPSVAAWSLDPTRNEGWLLSSSQVGCSVLTTESPDVLQYPELTVEFAPP